MYIKEKESRKVGMCILSEKGEYNMATTFFEEEVIMMNEEPVVKAEISCLKKKGQITIPSTIRNALNLLENDQIQISVEDGRIILQPVITIPKDQAWFWTKEWQAGEQEAQNDIAKGEFKTFDDIDDALNFLHED